MFSYQYKYIKAPTHLCQSSTSITFSTLYGWNTTQQQCDATGTASSSVRWGEMRLSSKKMKSKESTRLEHFNYCHKNYIFCHHGKCGLPFLDKVDYRDHLLKKHGDRCRIWCNKLSLFQWFFFLYILFFWFFFFFCLWLFLYYNPFLIFLVRDDWWSTFRFRLMSL